MTAIFQLYFAVELLLPVGLMPRWVRDFARFLPFESTFGFPITALVGPITGAELLLGLARQAFWIGVGTVGVNLMWRRGLRAYTAVNG